MEQKQHKKHENDPWRLLGEKDIERERGRKRGIAIGKECVWERERERDSTAEQESEVVRLSPNKFLSNVDYKSQEQWIKRLSVFVFVTMWHGYNVTFPEWIIKAYQMHIKCKYIIYQGQYYD